MAFWLRVLLMTGGLLGLVIAQCDVRVPAAEQPWPKAVYMLHNASVFIDCTTDSSNPFWSINPAEDELDTLLQFGSRGDVLNANGLYELIPLRMDVAPGELPTLTLLINNTEINNQTKIECVGDSITLKTVLHLYELSVLVLQAEELESTEESINISWIDPDQSNRLYNLAVVNSVNQQWTFTPQEPYHTFTAPEGASPCEIYNFSVTATYVGATYTGAGCSVPSHVLSTMLPSLPDISNLRSSRNFSLIKQTGEVVLTVYFQPARYCADYPVTNYSLEVTRVGVDSTGMLFTSGENFIRAVNLSEDAIYGFQLSATNSVGTVSTNLSQTIYTTDVQSVQVVATGIDTQVQVECDFISGSDADGCVVVLVSSGEVDNTTLNITRQSNSSNIAETEFELPSPLYCYSEAYALDIEADGSTGTLPIHGVLDHTGANADESCLPTDIPLRPRNNQLWWIGITIVALVVIVVVVAVAVIVICIVKRTHSKFKEHRLSIISTHSFEGSDPSPNPSDSTQMYAVVDKSKKSKRRTTGDGAENHKTSSELVTSTQLDSEGVTDVRVIHPTNEVDGSNVDVGPSQTDSEPLPDYRDVCMQQSTQEIPDESNEHMIEGLTPVHLIEPSVTPPPKVDLSYQDSDANSAPTSHTELVASSTQPQPTSSGSVGVAYPGPLYQEVGELLQRRTPVNETDNQENSITEANNEHYSEVRRAPPHADSTATATFPLYQEVEDITQRGKPVDSNKLVNDTDLIELSDMRDIPTIDDVEDVDSRLITSEFVGASPGPFGGIHPHRLYDEVTERPRLILPANFVEATDNYSPEPNLHDSHIQNSTPPPPDSSPIPTYATVTPRSARSRGTVDNEEQPPVLERHHNESPQLSHTYHTQNSTPDSPPIPAYATVTPPSARSRRTADILDQPPLLDNNLPELSQMSRTQNTAPPLPPRGLSPNPVYAAVTPPSTQSTRAADILDQHPQVDNDSPELSHTSRDHNTTPPIPTYSTVTPRSARSRRTVEHPPDLDHSHDSSPEPLHTSRIQNYTPPPPDSSPLPAYAAVAPHSVRSRGAEDVLEQPPKLELASPGLQPCPLSHFANGRYLPPEESFLDEWDDYKIPPEGTLV